MLNITGALRSSPTDTLEILSSLLPIELLLKKICFRAISRIYSLPVDHPLNKLAVNSYKKWNVDKQTTPLRLLPKILDLPSPNSIEKITPPKRARYMVPSFNIKILGNKEKNVERGV